jgi:hypothetical protein
MAMRRDSFYYSSSGGGFSGYQLVSVHEFENVHETVVDRTDPSGLSKTRLINKSRWDNNITANGIYLNTNADDSQLLPIGNFSRNVTQPIDVPVEVAGASFCNFAGGAERDPNTYVKIILFEDEPYYSNGTYDGGVMQQRYASYTNINPAQAKDKTNAYNNVMPYIANFVLNHTFNIPGTYNNGYFPYYETTFDLKYNAQIISSFAYKTDNEGDSLKYWARESTANPHGGTIGCIIVVQAYRDASGVQVGLAWRAGTGESEGWTPNNWYPAVATHNYYNGFTDRTPYGNYANTWTKRSITPSYSVPTYVEGVYRPNIGYSYVGVSGYTGDCVIAYIPEFNIESGYHWCMFHIER